MIRPWLITVDAGPQINECYGAYSEYDPIESMDFITINDINESLWDSYGWTVTGMDNEYIEGDTEEERDEHYDQMHEDFIDNISWSAEELEDIEDLEIIYDERDWEELDEEMD